MPRLDGISLAERAIASRPDLITIVITAHGQSADLKRALRCGVWEFIEKPFDPSVMSNRFANAVERVKVQRLEQRILAMLLTEYGLAQPAVWAKLRGAARYKALSELVSVLELRLARPSAAGKGGGNV
jgi:DNA-binding NtrC family response regulator